MGCARFKPTPALRDIVEAIWIIQRPETGAPPAPSLVAPTGTVEILFNYGDKFAHVNPGGVVSMPRHYVTGPRTRAVTVVNTGRVDVIIVSLLPWGLRALLPGSLTTPDGYTDLQDLVGAQTLRGFAERFAGEDAVWKRVELVEQFLLSLRVDTTPDHRASLAAQALTQWTGDHVVSLAAERVSLSPRHFSRLFKSEIGMSPKLFSRIMRLQRALRMRRLGLASWAAIAADSGYTDQAHMIHEVRRFLGVSPSGIQFADQLQRELFKGGSASQFFDSVYLAAAPQRHAG